MDPIFHGADWIWDADSLTVNQYVDFLTDFVLPLDLGLVFLYISVDSNYTVFINGLHIPASQFPDYPQFKIYDTLDITRFVKAGINRLCIAAYCQNEDSSTYRKTVPKLIFEIGSHNGTIVSSNVHILCRQSTVYENVGVEKITGQLSYSFRYNAEKDDGWISASYVPDKRDMWRTAIAVDGPKSLFSRPVEPLHEGGQISGSVISQGLFFDTVSQLSPCGDRMQFAALAHRNLTDIECQQSQACVPDKSGLAFEISSGDGLYILIDLEKEETGYLALELELPHAAEIIIGFGEHLNDLRVRSSVVGRQFAAVYHACAGRQQFVHRFKRIGCRYIQLHIYSCSATLYYAGLISVRYPVQYKKAVYIKDGLHRKIFEISRRTLELCMHDHYEDCPWREQALYAMDSRNQMLCGYYAFEGVRFAQASLHLLALGQREDGLLELCAPARVPITIPVFSLSFVTAVYEYVMHGGDKIFAVKMLPVIERILDTFLCRMDDCGLVAQFSGNDYWNFYEWQDGLDGNITIQNGGVALNETDLQTIYDAPLNALLSMALSDAAKLYCLLSLNEKENSYATSAQDLNRAMDIFWDDNHQLYITRIGDMGDHHYCELTQALMVVCSACNEPRKTVVLDKLACTQNGLLPATLSCRIFVYEALMLEPVKYAEDVIRDIANRWGDMLWSGATSFWETEKGASDFDNAGSLCHGWSAIPLYFYCRYGDLLFK